jgi:hypothetical protein
LSLIFRRKGGGQQTGGQYLTTGGGQQTGPQYFTTGTGQGGGAQYLTTGQGAGAQYFTTGAGRGAGAQYFTTGAGQGGTTTTGTGRQLYHPAVAASANSPRQTAAATAITNTLAVFFILTNLLNLN